MCVIHALKIPSQYPSFWMSLSVFGRAFPRICSDSLSVIQGKSYPASVAIFLVLLRLGRGKPYKAEWRPSGAQAVVVIAPPLASTATQKDWEAHETPVSALPAS